MRIAFALWLAAAFIVGSCAGAVSGVMPAVANWLGVALGLATIGAAILLHREKERGRDNRR